MDEEKRNFSKEIYKMDLFEEIRLDRNRMLSRVPGGWVLACFTNESLSTTFIRFNNEFMNK